MTSEVSILLLSDDTVVFVVVVVGQVWVIFVTLNVTQYSVEGINKLNY